MKLIKTKDARIKIIQRGLEETMDQITNEDWEHITDHRYPTSLKRRILGLMGSARKLGIPTESYENKLKPFGFY